jgi:PiT family inorganic phosphate transporter
VDPSVVLGALIGAIVWNLVTWYFGLPSSSSHALMGGFGGAAVAKAGAVALIGSGWVKPILFIVISPLLGMTLALLLTVGLSWALRRQQPGPLDAVFRRLQLCPPVSVFTHAGANDAQKTMGIIVSLLVASQALFAEQAGMLRHLHLVSADHIPMWIVLAAHAAIALGTAAGGWRIVKTMGSRITKLRPFGGFCAETAGGITILIASALGVPVSTTHTITGAIVGVGATRRISAVRWGVAGTIVWAWILTIPMSAAIAARRFHLRQTHQIENIPAGPHLHRVCRPHSYSPPARESVGGHKLLAGWRGRPSRARDRSSAPCATAAQSPGRPRWSAPTMAGSPTSPARRGSGSC